MRIVVPVFDGFTSLDAIGPYELLRMLPGAEVVFAAQSTAPVTDDAGWLTVIPSATLDATASADVLLVPGGPGASRNLGNEALLEWIRRIHATTRWTTSVCTGSLLLGAAGLLDGLTATTHWSAAGKLASFGATYTEQRVVEQPGGIITSAGVSSGIDMALRLAELAAGRVAAEAFQLAIEYDPQPPFDSGALSKASQEAKDYLAAR
ncbi:DJ-1/PfpI family protein [Streptomyces sp. NBC_00669]|uniref:DJ-1/PfpI family protein n=1 Tax=unclassified Streptomyces TaxID=2593676 RepID=UPI002E344C0C|nr:DJ-1/PfpI family protein [Streptomyces sp. NBC_00669]